MRSGKEELRYVLFRDEARERAWVAGEEGAVALVAESARSPLGVPVVVWVPPGQVVLAGWYTDVVTARLEF
jgi:spore coat protein U-like protein